MALSPKLLIGLLLIIASAGSLSTVAAESKGTVLITGANRGIGLALAEQFVDGGYTVIGTARKPDKARALKALGAEVEQLDVARQASVDALAQRLAARPIDILVNNAGIIGHATKDFAELDIDKLQGVIDVNVMGPLRVTQALLPNVQASERKVVADMSSMMGSMELNTWGCCLGYRASKAALNSLNKTLSVEYAKQGMTFVVLHPGYVKTDMNKGEGNITPAQSAQGLFQVISQLDQSNNGKFYDFSGKDMPW
ncbi:MAG: SDR family oxidoreductase [Halieaceae bacterium]